MSAPHRPNEESPPFPGQVFSFTGDQITYRTLLYNVFMHPKLAMALFAVVNRYWLWTICCLMLLCVSGGCGIAMSRAPEYAADIRQATDFLLHTVGPITIHEGKLDWETPPEGTLPATVHLPHLRVDIVESREDFQALAIQGGKQAGMVIAHDGIRFWNQSDSSESAAQGNSPILETAIPPSSMLQLFSQLPEHRKPEASSSASGKPFVLNQKNQSKICKIVFLLLFVAFATQQAQEIIIAIATSALIFTITMAFLFRIGRLRSFFALLLFALNATIPAALTAVIYMVAEIGSDFQSIFTVMVGIYMVYSLIEGRNGTILLPPHN